jgi:hypothetical protein
MVDKKFGIWMDNQNAVIVGGEDALAVKGHVISETASPNSSEKTSNNQEKMLQAKFFKEITTHILNATHVHLTGTGTAQEQFLHYLEDTPQFKNTKTTESTANKMSDEKLIEFMAKKLV